MTDYQDRQRQVVDQIEKQIQENKLTFSTVLPASDFTKDSRICLTSVHFPTETLKQKIHQTIIRPLQGQFPHHFYYPKESLHMTIKNIRITQDPPSFTDRDVRKVEQVFATVVPKHSVFNIYIYRLLLLPTNLSLIGTTDPDLDDLVLDLDRALRKKGIVDDKVYINKRYFFSNMTLARFTKPVTASFREKVAQLSSQLHFEPYCVDSVTLLEGNVALYKKKIIRTWML